MQTMKKLVALAATLFAVAAVAAPAAEAQESIPVANAQAFLGTWSVSIEGTPLEIVVKDANGQVAADINVMGTSSPATRIGRDGEALTLFYVADMQGQQAPISIKLTPSGENMATVVDVADGMFTASGTASKR